MLRSWLLLLLLFEWNEGQFVLHQLVYFASIRAAIKGGEVLFRNC